MASGVRIRVTATFSGIDNMEYERGIFVGPLEKQKLMILCLYILILLEPNMEKTSTTVEAHIDAFSIKKLFFPERVELL